MRKSQSYLHTDDTPSYMIKAEAALDAERERVYAYVEGRWRVIVIT